MFISDLYESKQRIVVIYAGGFQPFHQGHISSYNQSLVAFDFPNVDYYVASSNVTTTRPIPFKVKQFLAKEAGVDQPFIQVRSPMAPKEIMERYDKERDIMILVRSERDPVPYTKKDGSPGYFQPFTDIAKCEPFGKHGYVFVTKKHTFKIGHNEIFSGTQVRNLWSNANDTAKIAIVKELYPHSKKQAKITELLNQYLSTEQLTESEEFSFRMMISKFFPIVMRELNIKKLPKIDLERSLQISPERSTFGGYDPNSKSIRLALENRHPNDFLRTLAHELVHFWQDEHGELVDNSGETGSEQENQANAVAGVIMRRFNERYPEYINSKPFQ